MSGQKTSASSIKCGGFLDSERGFAYPRIGQVLGGAALSPFKQRTGTSTGARFWTNQDRRLGVSEARRAVFDLGWHHAVLIAPTSNDRN